MKLRIALAQLDLLVGDVDGNTTRLLAAAHEAHAAGATVLLTPELAVEIYAASVLAIDPDDPAEQAYLAMLASRLKLDPGLKAAVEAEARKTVA